MGKLKLPNIKIKNPFKVTLKKNGEGKAQIFFGSGKPIKFEKDKIEQLIELFLNKWVELKKKAIEETQGIEDNRFSKDRIYDFYRHMEQGTFSSANQIDFNGLQGGGDIVVPIAEQQPGNQEKDSKPSFKKPIEVLAELEIIPTPVNLKDIDKNIELLKKKEKLAAQLYSQYNIKAAIACLENRKKYDEFKEFYERFPYTNSDKIEALTSAYNLVLKTSEIFVPEFPEEAILIMDAYQEATMKLCGKKPTFYVIATKDDFTKKDKQRDPILLVQSPFGFYWQILGAWDKEMILLSEL